jgi:four helix bundle protein
MQKFRFLDWQVYRDSKDLFQTVLEITSKLSGQHKFTLGSQLIRSALSVVLNIAEGSGKNSDKELNRYFDIALGSLYEILAAVDVARDNRLISDKDFDGIFEKIQKISNQLGGFKKSLKRHL